MFGPSAWLTLPSLWMFKWPPDPLPFTLSSPSDAFTLKSPVNITQTLYDNLLAQNLPITFAILYTIVVSILNLLNARREYQPWWISRTRLFKGFVTLHNVFLALFSGLTCVAMVRAVSVSWPGLFGEYGVAGAADAMCKIHGPRGFGDAVIYNSSTLDWESKNRLIHLGDDGFTPDHTDVGRIWNEGLAFWGWLFYLSKYYEVVNTAITLAKGKRCTTLQMYQHAGALICVWAGIRYMSPPIWMFVMLNSGVNTIMYSYYALTSLGIKISGAIKPFITTAQVTQIILCTLFASAHLFVSYCAPISVRYTVTQAISGLPADISAGVESLSSAASELLSTASLSSLIAQATQPYALAWIKKLAFRAAGTEGLAEQVRNSEGNVFGPEYSDRTETVETVKEQLEEYRWNTEWQTTQCLDTSGQAFAIWLNLLYLAPLTLLFMRFLWNNYVQGQPAGRRAGEKRRELSEGVSDAARQTSDTIEAAGMKVEQGLGMVGDKIKQGGKELGIDIDNMLDKIKKEGQDAKNKLDLDGVLNRIKQEVQNGEEQLQEGWKNLNVDDVVNRVKKEAHQGKIRVDEVIDRIKKEVKAAADKLAGSDVGQAVEEQVTQGKNVVEQTADDVKQSANKYGNELGQVVGEQVDRAKQGVKQTADNINQSVDNVKHTADKLANKGIGLAAEEQVDRATKGVKQTAEDAKQSAQNYLGKDVGHAAEEQVDRAAKGAREMADYVKQSADKHAGKDIGRAAENTAAQAKKTAKQTADDVKHSADNGKHSTDKSLGGNKDVGQAIGEQADRAKKPASHAAPPSSLSRAGAGTPSKHKDNSKPIGSSSGSGSGSGSASSGLSGPQLRDGLVVGGSERSRVDADTLLVDLGTEDGDGAESAAFEHGEDVPARMRGPDFLHKPDHAPK